MMRARQGSVPIRGYDSDDVAHPRVGLRIDRTCGRCISRVSPFQRFPCFLLWLEECDEFPLMLRIPEEGARESLMFLEHTIPASPAYRYGVMELSLRVLAEHCEMQKVRFLWEMITAGAPCPPLV